MATIQGVYIALFGRPADPLGLAFFNEATNNGADLTAIGDLAATAEYQDRFEGMSNVQIVNSIYQSLFNRDADLAGLTFFVNALNNGELTINNIAIAIYDGAQGTDADILANKEAAADAFTAALNTGEEVVAYEGNEAAAAGRAFLAPITEDDATVPDAAAIDAAIAAIVEGDPSGGEGLIFTLAAAATETFAPNVATAANQTTDGDDLIRGLTAGALDSTDVIDGGAGVDTLTAVVDGTANAPVVKNVEIINLTAAAAASVFNAGNVTGAEQLWLRGDSAGNTLTLSNVSLATTVGFGAAGADADLSVGFSKVDGAADTANFAIAGANGDLTAAGVETVNLAVSAASTLKIATFADAETVNITGDKAVSVGLATGVVETVDATGLSAALSLTFAAADDATVSSGAGADTLTLNGAAGVLTVNSGAGADTISIDAGFAHKITTGDGKDTVNIDATAGGLAAADITTAAKLAAAAIEITDFVTGTDVANINATAATVTTLSGTDLADVADELNLLAAANKAASFGAGAAQTIEFQYGDDTYLLVDEDGSDTVSAADVLIKFTGVADLAASDFTVA